MASKEQYAQWIIANQDKKGTPEFETVAAAYKAASSQPAAVQENPNQDVATYVQGLAKRADEVAAGYSPTDPTVGMSGGEKFFAGAGMGMTNLARGAGQMAGIVSEEDVAKARERDAPLARTGAGSAGNVVGTVAAGLPTMLIPGANTYTGAALIGAGMGALQPTVEGESRAMNAATGALGGLAGRAIAGGVSRAINPQSYRAAKAASDAAGRKPSIDSLRAAKTAAYKAVDDSGLTFSPDDMNGLLNYAVKAADDANYVPDVDRQTFAAIKMIENSAGKDRTIGQLDKLRQGLWARYNASNGSEPAILDMIDGVDDIIAKHPATDDLMGLARSANSQFKKAELLDNAMTVAERQTAATGSGGNILNKYKQAVTSILNNPKKAKWFSPEEVQKMDDFIKGSFAQNALRQIGKISPTGNGLMQVLNIGAVAASPAMAGFTIAGAGAKMASDRAGRSAMQSILDGVAKNAAKPKPITPYAPGFPQAGAAGILELLQSSRDQ